jgi:hypothetical protein
MLYCCFVGGEDGVWGVGTGNAVAVEERMADITSTAQIS